MPSDDLGEDNEQRDAALVMTKKAQEEGCLWFIWRLTLVFIVAPGITLAVVIPIAEYVEDKWGQCVNVRIAAWMNSVTPSWRVGKNGQLARNVEMQLCRGSNTLLRLVTLGTALNRRFAASLDMGRRPPEISQNNPSAGGVDSQLER